MKIKIHSVLKAISLSICLAFCFGVFTAATASATTYYVSPSGSDSNPGTQSKPFKNIQTAANLVNPGDTVIVGNGVYTNPNSFSIVVNIARGGTASAPVTFKSQNLYGAVIDGQNNATSVGIQVAGVSYVTIQGFEIRNFGWCAIDNVNVGSSIANYITIRQNKMHDIGEWDYTDNYGLGASGAPTSSHNYTFDSNIIYNVGRTSTTNNWLDQVIYLSGYNHTLTNNVFYNPNGWKGACISIDAEYDPGDGKNIIIANNTFCDPQVARPGQITINWGVDNQISGMVIANNIFYKPATAGVWPYAYTSSGMTSVNILNNITTTSQMVTNPNSSDTAWNGTGVTLSNNLVSTDPKFVDAANHNYHLTASSPAINRASSTYAPNHDFDQVTRPQGTGYDVGAYEFQQISASTGKIPLPSILNLLLNNS